MLEYNSMPLFIASSGMMGRCPSSWGQPDNPSTQDLMGKVHMLEEVMSNFMEQQRVQMDKVSQELAAVRAGSNGPRTPRIQVVETMETPSKRKRVDDENLVVPTYAGATMTGVKPLGQHGQEHGQSQAGLKMIQTLLNQQKQGPSPRQQRNICFGTAKTAGVGKEVTHLAADVDLVASGVSKDCSNDDLKDFLENKGVNAVAVETLTKDEALVNVRTKTFKVTVTAAQYEKALQPESWPYRVGVRHFRAPRRPETSWQAQSGRAGGLVDRDAQGGGHAGIPPHQRSGSQLHGGGDHVQGGGGPQQGDNGQYSEGRQYPVGHPNRYRQQRQSLPDPVQISNLFGILGQLGGLEVPRS